MTKQSFPTFRYYYLNPTALNFIHESSTVDTIISSDTPVLIDSMTLQPGIGDFKISFRSTFSTNFDLTSPISIGVYYLGTLIPESAVTLTSKKDNRYLIVTDAFIQGVGTGDTVEIKASISDPTKQITFHERVMYAQKM